MINGLLIYIRLQWKVVEIIAQYLNKQLALKDANWFENMIKIDTICKFAKFLARVLFHSIKINLRIFILNLKKKRRYMIVIHTPSEKNMIIYIFKNKKSLKWLIEN